MNTVNNLFYFNHLNALGGTEQFLYEIVKKYSKDFDIAVAYENGAVSQIKRLSKYVRLIKWQKGMKIKCKKAFVNYNVDIIDDLICDDIYFVCHAIFQECGYKLELHPRIKGTITVSEYAKKRYEELSNVPCEVSYNPISKDRMKRPVILMSAFRANDPVKGMGRVRNFAQHLDAYCAKHGTRYLWFIFSNKPNIEADSDNVVIIPPRNDVRSLMPIADWGVTLSNDMETYCYTNVEFLMHNVPIITTPLTVADELKMDSSMRVILNYDLSNVEEVVDAVFNRKMKFSYEPPEDRWDEILEKGKPQKYKNDIKTVLVRANSVSYDKGVPLMELGRIVKAGEVFETTTDRLDNLVKGNNPYNTPFARLERD